MEYTDFIFMLAWFLGGFVNGVGGMGAAMVAVPIMTTFMPPAMLTPVSCIIVTMISAHMAYNFREGCRYHSLKNLLIGALAGSFMGVILLLYIKTQYIQIFTGLVMLVFVAWQSLRKAQVLTQERPETLGKSLFAGFCSGVLNSSISFGNPPVGVYALHLGWSQVQTVGTMNIFSLFAYLVACGFQASAGLYTKDVLIFAAMGMPAAALGILCSLPVARRIPALIFKRILLAVIALGGVACMWRGLAF